MVYLSLVTQSRKSLEDSFKSMKRLALFSIIFSSLTVSLAMADEETTTHAMAQKDYSAAMAKIRTDDATAINRCRSGIGGAVEACLIQARGKRKRAEQEAKSKVDQPTPMQPLPDALAKNASRDMLKAAKDGKRSAYDDIELETKAANVECKKLSGADRKICMDDVAQREREARDMADTLYDRARGDAKALKPP